MQPYFSHDIFTRENLKIKRLISRHGMQGYGVFWAIIEFLHNNENKLLMDELSIIAFDLGVDIKIVESVIKDFKFFSIRKNVISSNRVAQNIKLRKEKSEKAKKSARRRWQESSADANALPTQSERNAIKESKEKKKKEKEIKENEKKEDESIEKEIKEKEIKENEEDNKKESKNQSSNTELNKNNSMSDAQLPLQSEQTPDNNQQFFTFYGSANNVHITPKQYASLCDMHGKDIVDTVISELSYKIAIGKEQAFDAEFPNLHLVRLDRYARQKIATTTGTAGRAKGTAIKNKSPSGVAAGEKSKSGTEDNTPQEEEEFVPPPPEFFEAGERLRRLVNGRKL